MTRTLPLADLRPTQLYLSSEKLAAAMEWFDFDNPNCDPLPVFEHDGEWYLSDGHTRAFLVYLSGDGQVEVVHDEEVREKYDFDVYLAAIEWCREEGIQTVADLAGRIVEPDTYEEVWIQRCQRVGQQ